MKCDICIQMKQDHYWETSSTSNVTRLVWYTQSKATIYPNIFSSNRMSQDILGNSA